VLGVAHPLYTRWRSVWVKLLDVYEGAGGFLDESKPYLIAHPREWLDHSTPVYGTNGELLRYEPNANPRSPSAKLKERRKLARYENIAATLIDQLSGALFRVKPDRSFADEGASPVLRPIQQFWQDSDGNGTAWNDSLMEAWSPCAAFGHMWGYVDVLPDDPRRAIVKWYTPVDVVDWLVNDQGALTAVKFLEAVPRETFAKLSNTQSVDIRVREVTADGWRLLNRAGKVISEGSHDFGKVPAFVLYAKRRALTPFIGRSVLGDPQLFIDLYNLISETRELLRKQTFSILNVPIGDAPGGVQREQELIGQQSGTGNILFTTNSAQMLSPDNSNVTSYHEHIDRLTRLIYRLSILPWEGDGRATESGDSRRIKREDLNQQLASFADELQRVDEFVTSLVYRAYYGEAAATWEERDALTIRWPQSFEVTPLEQLTKQFSEALMLDLGPTASGEIRRRAARAVLPDLNQETLASIDEEIDNAPTESADTRRQKAMDALTARMQTSMEMSDIEQEAAREAESVDVEDTEQVNGRNA
jgi:hypothetical protein